MFAIPKRHAECGGRFASSLLGHTVVRGRDRKGAIGIESVIDRSGITGPEVFLTMDAGIQEQCESFLDRILAVRVPFYTYVTVLDSEGGLIAAAQRPTRTLHRCESTLTSTMCSAKRRAAFPCWRARGWR